MGDHFWPSLYPGLIVGLLIGLSLRGIQNVVLGTIGGLIGAVIATTVLSYAAQAEGLISVVVTIGGSALGAYALLRLGQMLRPPR